jgi:hypothetical protein
MRLTRPVTAAALLDSPEMLLRYPTEIELRRGGTDEGEGRGFDLMDLSAGAERSIAVAKDAKSVVEWFLYQLTGLGWTSDGDGGLSRDQGEHFLVRVERDRGLSRIGALIPDPATRRMQEEFESSYYGAPDGSSIVTLFYTVAPEAHILPRP